MKDTENNELIITGRYLLPSIEDEWLPRIVIYFNRKGKCELVRKRRFMLKVPRFLHKIIWIEYLNV